MSRASCAANRPSLTALWISRWDGDATRWRLPGSGGACSGLTLYLDAIREARDRAAAEGLVVRAWCADLLVTPLPSAAFELIVVTRYLQRDLFDSIRDAVVPNGVVIYETFTIHQRALGFGPKSPDHLLEPGELRARFDGFDILSSEEVSGPEAVARLVARRRA